MGLQFLCNDVFVNGADVHIDIVVEQLQLDTIHIHGCEKSDIVGEQFEDASFSGECQRRSRFV